MGILLSDAFMTAQRGVRWYKVDSRHSCREEMKHEGTRSPCSTAGCQTSSGSCSLLPLIEHRQDLQCPLANIPPSTLSTAPLT